MEGCIGHDPACPCQDGLACHYIPSAPEWAIRARNDLIRQGDPGPILAVFRISGGMREIYRFEMTMAPSIPISARLYEELKDYLSMETDMKAGQLLRRLRECVDAQ